MGRKYVFVRMPVDVYELFKNKKIKMEKSIQYMTGKKIPMTMPKVFKVIGQNPVEVDHDYLIKIAKQKRKKQNAFTF